MKTILKIISCTECLTILLLLIFVPSSLRMNAQTVVASTEVTPGNCGMVSFRDGRDGKVYGTVKLGAQCWMSEDLRFGTCSSSSFALHCRGSVMNQIAPGYFGVCHPGSVGGSLYNWQGAMNSMSAAFGTTSESGENTTSFRGVCPMGWVIPTGGKDSDWQQLYESLPRPTDIYSSEINSFQGRFNGTSDEDRIIFDHKCGYYWSSTNRDGTTAYSTYFHKDYTNKQSYSPKYYGFAVRCIRDENASTILLSGGSIASADERVCPLNRFLRIRSVTDAKVVGSTEAITYRWYVNDLLVPDSTGFGLTYPWERGKSYQFRREAFCGGEVASSELPVPITVPPTFKITSYKDQSIDFCPEPTECKIVMNWSYAHINGCSGGVEYTCSLDGIPLAGSFSNAYLTHRFPWDSGPYTVRCTTTFIGDTLLEIAPVVDEYIVMIPPTTDFSINCYLGCLYIPSTSGNSCYCHLFCNANINDCSDYLRYEWWKDGVLLPDISSEFLIGPNDWEKSLGTYVCKVYFGAGAGDDLGILPKEEIFVLRTPARPTEINGGTLYDCEIEEGQSTNIYGYSASVLDTSNGITYTWQINGESVSGSGSSLTFPSNSPAGSYVVSRTAYWNELQSTVSCTVTVKPTSSESK